MNAWAYKTMQTQFEPSLDILRLEILQRVRLPSKVETLDE
jgi:hypothetical protein